MHGRAQGDIGELAALNWYARCGCQVLVPLGHAPDYDLVIDGGEGLRRIQVKTTAQLRSGRWVVTLRTSGGNRSWSGTVRRFSSERCDELFVLCADGRQWCLPSEEVGGATEISLGGEKYAGYEVDRGLPIPGWCAPVRRRLG